jgi:hypothetical protein
MGTSSSNGGPSGKGSLLPSWYNDTSGGQGQEAANPDLSGNQTEGGDQQGGSQDSQAEAIPKTSGDWKDAKGAFTRYTKNTGGSNIRKAAKKYVRTLGGSRGATHSASSGISAGRGLVSFLGAVSSSFGGGLNQTLTKLGLTEFIGHSSEETLAKIADAIAPVGATNDEAIARDAVIATLDLLYTKILENGGDITALESLTPNMIKETVIDYVGVYIFKKWVYELGLAVEKNAVTEKQAIEMETEIKDFIYAEVKLSLQGKDIREFNLNDRTNQQIIENIFQAAYSTLDE